MSKGDSPQSVSAAAVESPDYLEEWCHDHPNRWWHYRHDACAFQTIDVVIYSTNRLTITGGAHFEAFHSMLIDSYVLNGYHRVFTKRKTFWGEGGSVTHDLDMLCVYCTVTSPDQVGPTPPGQSSFGEWYFRSNLPTATTGNILEGQTVAAFAFWVRPLEAQYPATRGAVFRCDNVLYNSNGCVFPVAEPTYYLDLGGPYGEVAQHVLEAQSSGLPGRPGTQPLRRLIAPLLITANRTTACPGSLPRPEGKSCDEYPFASTWEGASTGGGAFSRKFITDTQNSAEGSHRQWQFYDPNRLLELDKFWVSVGGGGGGPYPGDMGSGSGPGTPALSVHQIWGDSAGWHIGSTGITTDNVSAVNMGGQWPQVMALKNGVLQQIWGDTSGWHIASTGISVGTISAVNMGGQWPQVMAIKNGVLHHIWGDGNGWHIASTGISVDKISAVNMGGQWPQVMAIKNGVLHQIWADTSGWHIGSTGISASAISAVNVGGQWPQIMALKNGVLHQIWADTGGWHVATTGISADTISAVNMGGQWPQVMALKNGVVHQIWADTGGWHIASTGISARTISAVTMGGQWPQVMAIA